ncbi:MAG TPA: hypothetical protein VE076_03470, partial [Nitrososphaeraceae archaeon]|nr:hypothetical protein [Nitrososphaeraceae archaeon]
ATDDSFVTISGFPLQLYKVLFDTILVNYKSLINQLLDPYFKSSFAVITQLKNSYTNILKFSAVISLLVSMKIITFFVSYHYNIIVESDLELFYLKTGTRVEG